MTTNASSSHSLFDRMVRAAQLDINLYEEVEHDTSVNLQAFAAVVITSLASGLGLGIGGILEHTHSPIWFLWGLLIGLGTAIAGWLIWSFVTYV